MQSYGKKSKMQGMVLLLPQKNITDYAMEFILFYY